MKTRTGDALRSLDPRIERDRQAGAIRDGIVVAAGTVPSGPVRAMVS
jgi:hypothetical protein